MRKILTTAIAAITLGATALTAAAPASAAPHGSYHGGGGYYHGGYRGGYGYGRGYGYGGVALAGLAGLAIGSALASPYYYGPGPGYYGDYYGPGPGYATCYAPHRVWDGYRWIYERTPYAC